MTPYPLSRSETGTKILITLFLVTMAVSILVAELNVNDKVRFTANGVVARYGPDVEIPDDGAELPSLEEEPLVVRMNTFTLLLDVTHPHVFELPLVVFVLAHFLMRTRVGNSFKIAVYVASFGGIAAFLGAPWLVRYVSVSFAPVMIAGAAFVGVSSVLMIAVSLWDLWRSGTQSRSRERSGSITT